MNNEIQALKIITEVGSARSYFIEAIRCAKHNDFEGAQSNLDLGDQHYIAGHKEHTHLVVQESKGEGVDMTLLLTHAQDLLMSAEAFKILATEFIDLYRHIHKEHH
jgi:cellobiose PTS system EIIA component